MSDIINDNGVVGFTRQLTLSVSGIVICDNFKLDVAANASFERTNNKSKTTGYSEAIGIQKGTGQIQIPSASFNPRTLLGQTFTESEGTFFICSPVGKTEDKSGETKISITFREAVGSVVVS